MTCLVECVFQMKQKIYTCMFYFNMITGINESRTLTKHISYKWECKFDGRECNLNQKWNKDKCPWECKNLKENRACKKGYFWNLATCSCQNGKYVGRIFFSVQ